MTQHRQDVQPTAFIGFESPIARFFTRRYVDRCAEVIVFDSPDSVAINRHKTTIADRPITSVVGLITWADLVRHPPDVAIRALLECSTSKPTLGAVKLVVLCIVPFASFVDAERHSTQFVAAKTGSTPLSLDDLGAYERLANLVRSAGYACELAVSPMVLAEDDDELSGYPSLLQKLIRTARCLNDEVATKVPEYFSKFALQLQLGASVHFNAATSADLSSWLLSRCANGPDADAPPVICLESVLPMQALAEQLRTALDASLRSSDDPAGLTALDTLFNELVWSDQDSDFTAAQYTVPRSSARVLVADGIEHVVSRLAAKPCEPWECSYAPLRNRDIKKVPGLLRKDLAAPSTDVVSSVGEPSPASFYFAGGAGDAVLLLTPIGIPAGHYASLVTDLMRDHRVLVWPTRRDAAVQMTCIQKMLEAEGVEKFHLFTWCSSVIFASMLVEVSPSRVRSLTMLAPGVGDEPLTDAIKKTFWLAEQIRKHPSQAHRIEMWSNPGFKQTAGDDLDQYASGKKVIRSPLQHHPVGFWPTPEADQKRTQGFLQLFLGWEQDSPRGQDVSRFREQLGKYQGSVLAVVATHDHLTHYAGVMKSCRTHARWTLVTLLGGNHYAIIEHAPAFAALLRRFFRDGRIVARPPHTVRGQRLRIDDDRPRGAGERTTWSSIS
jgi:hypothetical protein